MKLFDKSGSRLVAEVSQRIYGNLMNSILSELRRKPYLIIAIMAWLVGIFLYVFRFEDVSDNRMFIPGLVGLIVLPVAIFHDLRKK